MLRKVGPSLVYMYAFHMLRYMFPLFYLFLISKYLQVQDIAKILSAQSLALMVSQLLEYGFGTFAARGISSERDSSRMASTVNTVLAAQMILILPTIAVAIACIAVSPLLSHDVGLATPLIIYLCALGLTPMWYFHGRLEFRRSAIIEAVSLSVSVASLVCIVWGSSELHASYILWALAAGPLITTMYGWSRIYKESPISLSIRDGAMALYSGFSIFVMKAATVTYTSGSIWIAGILCTDSQTARFGAVMKLVAAASSLAIPLSQVIMPFVSTSISENGQSDMAKNRHTGYLLFLVPALIINLLLYIFAPSICLILLKNPDYSGTFRLALLMLFPIAVSMCLSSVVHIPMRRERQLSLVTLVGGLVILILSYELGRSDGADGLVTARILGEILISALSLFIAQNYFAASAFRTASTSVRKTGERSKRAAS